MRNRLRTAWANLIHAKNLKTNIEPTLGSTAFDILCLISYEPTTRATILRHKQFQNVSLSTIKRAVTELLSHGLITATLGDDGRKRVLDLANDL